MWRNVLDQNIIMVQGTTSCLSNLYSNPAYVDVKGIDYKEDGYNVAPFKSQNMSSKYYETKEGYKMSTAQALQAKAAGIKPNPNMNPILLKPNSDRQSDIIIKGKLYKKMGALEYFDFKKDLKPMIIETYEDLERDYKIIVIEGAGSPAEINLKENDIVNMGMAEMVDAPVILVADIDRGGVFASLYGHSYAFRRT